MIHFLFVLVGTFCGLVVVTVSATPVDSHQEEISLVPVKDIKPKGPVEHLFKEELYARESSDPSSVKCTLVWRNDYRGTLLKGKKLKVEKLAHTADETVIRVVFEDDSIFEDFGCYNRSREKVTVELYQKMLKGVFEVEKSVK